MVSMVWYVGFYELLVLWAVSTHPSGGCREGVWWVRKGRKYIHWKRPTLFALSYFVPSPLSRQLAKAAKQAVPDTLREERLD